MKDDTNVIAFYVQMLLSQKKENHVVIVDSGISYALVTQMESINGKDKNGSWFLWEIIDAIQNV